MDSSKVPSTFTLGRVEQLLGLSRRVVSGLIAEGFVAPSRGPKNELLFSFQDLALLRTVHGLRKANVAPRQIAKSLAKLRADLPPELPLTGLRITALGSKVVVQERTRQWYADSGQLLIDFEIAPLTSSVTELQRRDAPPSKGAEECFNQGVALEDVDASGAERAYREAIELDPGCVDAYLNLGALLCQNERSAEAIALYAEGLKLHLDHATLHFNHAVALEDQQRPAEALEAYRKALAVDPALADAHFNAARLFQDAGDFQGSLRHYSAYRRLQASRP